MTDQNKPKEFYDQGYMVINGNEYKAGTATFEERITVLCELMDVQNMLAVKNFSFVESDSFSEVQQIMEEHFLFDGMMISKIKDHWEKHTDDYLEFVCMGMAVMSQPFMAEGEEMNSDFSPKDSYENGVMTINGKNYVIGENKHGVTFKERRKVVVYMTEIQDRIAKNNLSFVNKNRFKPIARIMENHFLIDGKPLKDHVNYWQENTSDYLAFAVKGMAVMSVPFKSGNAGD